MHQVLILGAGLVSRPIIDHFLAKPDYRLTVGTLEIEDARNLLNDHPRGAARKVDVTRDVDIEPLIRDADLVISLVPYAFHVRVARLTIRHRVNMVTTSYTSPEMRALDAEAREAGVTIVNEIGLDPGLDHMSAVRMINRVRQDGGSVVEFQSCTGGLPAPEASHNPWRYKFSWSPRGALLAACYPARYLENGRVFHIPADALFDRRRPYEIEGLGSFEMYSNRDSLRYVETFRIPEVESMQRGTIRYPGWCETMKALGQLGLLDVAEREWPVGTTYADFIASCLPEGNGTVAGRLAAHLGIEEDHAIVERLEWAGLLSQEPLPRGVTAPLDILAHVLQGKMRYDAGERDMVVMCHRITARYPDGATEKMTSRLITYGEPDGHSATSRTVSLPAAMAATMILEGRLRMPGIHIPTLPEIYDPILDALEGLDIRFEESVERIDPV